MSYCLNVLLSVPYNVNRSFNYIEYPIKILIIILNYNSILRFKKLLAKNT